MTIKAQEIILDHAVDLVRPLRVAVNDTEALERLLGFIGWDAAAAGLAPTDVQEAFEVCRKAIEQVEALIRNGVEDIVGLARGLQTILPGFEAVRGLAGKWQNPGDLPASVPQTFVEDLFFWLVDVYAAQRMGRVRAALELVGLITRTPHPGISRSNGTVVRQPMVRMRFDFTHAGRLLKDPAGLLRDRFVNDVSGQRTAEAVFALLAPYLVQLLNEFGLTAFYGTPGASADQSLTAAQQALAARLLHITYLFVPQAPPAASSRLDAIVDLVEVDGAFALIVAPTGALAVDTTSGLLTFKLITKGTIQPLVVQRSGVSFKDEATSQLAIELTAGRHPPPQEGPLLRLGGEKGTRFVVSYIDIQFRANLEANGMELDLRYLPGGVSLAIASSDGDGFLNRVLPEQPIVIPFALGVGWSNIKGLYFSGSAGLEATLPVHQDFLGVLKIDSVYLALRVKNSNVETVVATTAGVRLGPFTANVERIGLLARLTFPPSGGNLGLANLDLSFKPPDGAGMAIDASAIVGGGYLKFDKINEQYAGILQLEVKGGISLKAIGLLTTRLPGLPPGTKGFSLLVIISAEFPPIQLGFGFTLTGVGGLLGVNRTMVLEVLRSGIKNRTLDSVLFPQNPVANAPKIISDLQSIFPPVTGQYVFGPMAKLAWGTPTILTVELGIVLEFPSPLRLAIMGQLRMVLPSEEVPDEFKVVVLRMDVLGTIDFDKGDASIDATLYDSRIAQFVVSGDMAMRLNWGASPAFALSVGGFNPRFQPPPNFPSLARLAIALATGDNPRIRLEAYLALTSNTVQLGARLDVYAAYDWKLTKAEAAAYLSFDALVYLSPFSFIVDIEGYISIKVPPWPTISAWLYLSLSGPNPWHGQGGVTVEFFGKRHLPIDVKVGEAKPPPPLPQGDPLGDLRNALADTRNWSAQLPTNGHMLVTLRRIPNSENTPEVLMHPFGELSFRQKGVPLDTPISKYGSTRPLNSGPFTLTEVTFEGKSTEETRQSVRDLFAPGQFFELSDDQKLSRPSFESLPSGCTGIGTSAFSYTEKDNKIVTADFQYDTVVIDKKEERISRRGQGFEYAIAEDVLLAVAGLGAAGQSALDLTGAAKFAGSPANRVQVNDVEYVVVSKEDMKGEDPEPSYLEAELGRSTKGAASGQYQVVGKHEVAQLWQHQ